MKPISIATQEKIKFIPWVNMSLLFIWFYNSIVLKIPSKIVWKSYPFILGIIIPWAILLSFINQQLSDVKFILYFLSQIVTYCFFTLLAHGLIQFQKNLQQH